ncbi:MAG TPA: TetR/AcrR family transcriptional regulator [Acidimicrobiales bacterium]
MTRELETGTRRRRTGRPRRDGTQVVGDPTTEILAVAGRLFGELGVEATTMSRIASEVGLGQSSLYYYFRSREEVVAALVATANVVPLELIDRVTSSAGSVASKLFRFVRSDVEVLCALPFDINEIHRIAARERARFDGYWRERARLERRLSALVREGVAAGELRPVEPRLTALSILANDEGTQNWFRVGVRYSPSKSARAMATLTVAGLLATPRTIDDVIDEVAALGS